MQWLNPKASVCFRTEAPIHLNGIFPPRTVNNWGRRTVVLLEKIFQVRGPQNPSPRVKSPACGFSQQGYIPHSATSGADWKYTHVHPHTVFNLQHIGSPSIYLFIFQPLTPYHIYGAALVLKSLKASVSGSKHGPESHLNCTLQVSL